MIEGRIGEVDKAAGSQKGGVTGGIQMRGGVGGGGDEGSPSDLIHWECLTESLREGNLAQGPEDVAGKPAQMSQPR